MLTAPETQRLGFTPLINSTEQNLDVVVSSASNIIVKNLTLLPGNEKIFLIYQYPE